MSSVAPLSRENLKEFEDLFDPIEATMGFVPNSFLTSGSCARSVAAPFGPNSNSWWHI